MPATPTGAWHLPGHSSLYVLAPVPNLRADIDWGQERARFRSLVLKRLELLGVPDLSNRIRYEKMIDPEGWRDDYAIYEGATFNLSHDLRQMLYFRPHNRFGKGIYLVGGGTHPGSGLPVIYEGARITARLLLQDLLAGGTTQTHNLEDLEPSDEGQRSLEPVLARAVPRTAAAPFTAGSSVVVPSVAVQGSDR